MANKPRFFDTNFYYHIYNCGVGKQETFTTDWDYQRFLETLDFYLHEQKISYAQFQNLNEKAKQIYTQLNLKGLKTLKVKVISYCLMPNHFHLLLKPTKEQAVPQFMSDITNSYTRYFNIKNDRIGSLFQGTYKSKEITDEESLLQVTRYIHLNPVNSKKTNRDGNLKPEDYPFSSYKDWINPNLLNLKGLILDREEVWGCVKLVGGSEGYRSFVEAKIGQNAKLGIESLTID